MLIGAIDVLSAVNLIWEWVKHRPKQLSSGKQITLIGSYWKMILWHISPVLIPTHNMITFTGFLNTTLFQEERFDYLGQQAGRWVEWRVLHSQPEGGLFVATDCSHAPPDAGSQLVTDEDRTATTQLQYIITFSLELIVNNIDHTFLNKFLVYVTLMKDSTK